MAKSLDKVDLKVVLLGGADVGKTCLLERFAFDKFSMNSSSTVGVSFIRRKVPVSESDSVTLGVWDTAGSEKFASMSRLYYRDANAAILCYDISSKDSVKQMEKWIEELLQNEPNCYIYIVGTKGDLEDKREVTTAKIEAVVRQCDAKAQFITSALNGKNVEPLFERVASDWWAVEKATMKNQPNRLTLGVMPSIGRRDGTSNGGCSC